VQIQKEKEQLLARKIGVKETITRELGSVTGLEQREEETAKSQARKIVESI